MLKTLRTEAVESFYYQLSKSGEYYNIVGKYTRAVMTTRVSGINTYFVGLVYTDNEDVPKEIVKKLNEALTSLNEANDLMGQYRSKGL